MSAPCRSRLTPLTLSHTVYHIHDQPVPANGNCTATGGHLDPFLVGDAASCDSSAPQACEVGDLSGKHGKVTSDPFSATYTDDYASLVEGLGSFLGNRSIVLHTADKTRITCANFTAISVGTGAPAASACGSSSSLATTRGVTAPTARPSGARNATATYSTPSASSSIVMAGGNANAPALVLAVGAAALAYAM